jgi:hypothetical protein
MGRSNPKGRNLAASLCAGLVLGLVSGVVSLVGTGLHAAAVSRYASTVLADHPLGYWRLGESSGTTAFDSSGNGHNGTYVGGVTLGVPGLIGNGDPDTAASFSGSGHVDLGTLNLNLSTVTLEAWINPTSYASSYRRLVSSLRRGRANHWISCRRSRVDPSCVVAVTMSAFACCRQQLDRSKGS